MSDVASTSAEPRVLLTIPQCAAAMGCNPATVWRHILSGRFGPAVVHIGRLARVRGGEFDDWILAGCPPRARWSWPKARG